MVGKTLSLIFPSPHNLRIEERERTSAENLFIMCINLIVTETEWMCILPISAVITVIYDARRFFFATNERKRENAPCGKWVGGRWKSVEDKNGARLRCASISTKVSVCGGVIFSPYRFSLLREAEIRRRGRKYQPRERKMVQICVARLERKKVAANDKKVVKISFPLAQNEGPGTEDSRRGDVYG